MYKKIKRKVEYLAVRHLFKNQVENKHIYPLVSFTFDDFPLSAKTIGAAILNESGVRGTFYASLGFLEKSTEGEIYFSPKDVSELLSDGHEIGCHTYHHLNAEKSTHNDYANSIIKNSELYSEYFIGESFSSFSYPFGGININAKKTASKFFNTARTNWQGINQGLTDLWLLKANKLYSSEQSLEMNKNLITQNLKTRGWLIFYTHDVCSNPSKYGCTAEYFEEIVRFAVASGSVVKPVKEAVKLITSQ